MRILAAAVLALVLASPAIAQAAESCRDLSDPACRAELEPKCRKMSEDMLAYMKATPPGSAESHRRRHAEILAKTEKAIADGRAKGWCETLKRIQDIVVHQ
ncbi:MAG: hypothetical protein AB7P08_08020 [Burkholderiales bacterium]